MTDDKAIDAAAPSGELPSLESLLAQLPADRLYAPAQDMWVRLEEDGLARLGATHLVAAHGQFMFFTPRGPGTLVEYDRSLGVMETAKTAVAIHSPVTCRVVAVNDAVAGDVAPVEREPYGEGWMFVVEPTNLEREREALLDAEAYARWLRADDTRLTPPRPFVEDLAGEIFIDPHQGY